MANSHIISLIQGLSSLEIRLIEEHLNKTQALFEKDNYMAMEIKLFKYIVANKQEIITDDIIISQTGTKRTTDLKNNLFSKVLEALTQDKYITNTELFNQIDIANFTLRKKLLISKISIRTSNSNKTETIHVLLNEIIEEAKKYELYDILVDALNTKKYFIGFRRGMAEFDKLNAEIKLASDCYWALINANDLYFKLILNNEFIKALTKSEADEFITTAIKQLEVDYKSTKSEHVNYYLHIMRFALFERQKNYTAAIEQCNKLIPILKKHESISRQERMGLVYNNLSLFKTFLEQYADAAKDAKLAQKYYPDNSLNHAVSKEHEFYLHFYNEDYEAANKCLNALLSHSQIDTGEFRRSKYIYYRACVYFAEKSFKEALSLLNQSFEIEKDKTRWNISLRILNIMIFIEMDKIDEAVTSLEALRKYMERTGKTDEVRPRDVLIVKLLRELEKNNFEPQADNKAASKMLQQLSEKDSDTSWEYFSSELLPFHEWLKKKYKGGHK